MREAYSVARLLLPNYREDFKGNFVCLWYLARINWECCQHDGGLVIKMPSEAALSL